MKKLCVFLLASLLFTACHKDDEVVIPNAPNTVNRTVLVYMIADNSLDGNVDSNLNGMKVGLKNATDIGNLLIYLDRRSHKPALLKYSKRVDGEVVEDTLKRYPEQNSVDVSVMKQVFKDAYEAYPAYNYGLVLWSHGYDWIPYTKTKTISSRWFGQDTEDASGYIDNRMNIAELSTALITAPHLDFILFDACLMSSVEVAYQFKNQTDYLIASPTEVLSYGYPYDQIIAPMFSPQKDYKEMGVQFFNYYNAMEGELKSATIAMTKCSEMDKLATEVRQIVTAHLSDLKILNLSSIQLYNRYLNNDYRKYSFDLAAVIKSIATPEEFKRFSTQLNKTVIYKASTGLMINLKIDPNQFSGIGMYVPQKNTYPLNYTPWNNYFCTLDWYENSGLNLFYDSIK